VIPFIGFLPDLEATTPGLIVDCENAIPSDRGFEGGPSQIDAVSGLAALTAQCRGSAVLTNTTGTRRHFAGTQTDMYELSGTAWVDVSRTANYTGSSENRWLFDQFGNVALATNDTEKIQASTSGVFQDITAAPIARIVFAMDNFVMALNTNDTTYGDTPDRWWCSAYQDHSSWTANVTTQATTGRLIGSGGELTAGARLGPYAVAYKTKSIFLGSYVGPPVVWQWDRIPGDIGCIGPEAVTDIGGAHIFVGEDNIWMFDGTRPQPVAEGIRQWFFDNSSAANRYRTILRYDRQNNRLWFFYPSASSSGACDSALVWHLPTKRWGRADQNVEAAVNFVTPGLTWDTMSTLGATWDTLPNIPWDSQSFQAGGQALAVFNDSHELKTLTGTSAGGSITTGDMGDDDAVGRLTQVRLRFLRTPTSASAQGSTKMTEGDSLVVASSSTLSSDGKFDMRQSGRWHRVAFTMVGPWEASGIRPKFVPVGQR
jgi:hypothetical protein